MTTPPKAHETPSHAPRPSRTAAPPLRDRAFLAIASLGIRRPWQILASAGALVLLAALLVPGMRISTSRHTLVDPHNPYQTRLLAFFERFGLPDSPVLVVSGGTAETQRRFIDRLVPRLDGEPALHGRVLARIGPEEIAEVLAVQQPDALAALAARAGLGGDNAALIEGGLPAWIGAVTAGVEAGLAGQAGDAAGARNVDPASADPATAAPATADPASADPATAAPATADPASADPATADPATADEGLARLATMARALDDALGGNDPLLRLAALGPARSDADLAARLREQSLDAEGYLATDNGEHHLVALFPDLPGDEAHQVAPLVKRVREIRDATLAEEHATGVTARLTGLPALSADELPIVEKGVYDTTIVSTIAIIGLLLLLFRAVRPTLLCLVPLGAGTVLTLGATRLLYGGFNLVTSGFVSVLLGLGIDFGVYLLRRHAELKQEGAPSDAATRGALVSAGPGIVTGSVTTMLAFLTAATTEFTAYAELSVITSVGLLLTVLCALVLVPALLKLTDRDSDRGGGRPQATQRPEARPDEPAGALPHRAPAPERGMGKLAPVVRKGRYPILAVAAFGAVIGAVGLSGIRWNGRYFDFLPPHTESAAGLRLIEHDPRMGPLFAAVTAGSVDEARAKSAALRALPSVAAVQTPTDLLPPLDERRLAALRSALAALDGAGQEGRRPLDPRRLAARASTAGEVMPRLDALLDAVDEAAFALRQSGRNAKAADDAKAALAALKRRIAALPDGGRVAIGALEAKAARLLDRAITAARRIAARGGYAPDDVPPLFRNRFVSRDGAALALYVRPKGNIWDATVGQQFSADVRRVAPEAAGLAMTIYEHERMIRRGFTGAAIVSAALVLLILLLDFRNLQDTALTLLTLLVGWLWTLGAMRLAGLTFNVANIVVLPLLLGMGVDAGAHMMHRFRESAAHAGGVADLAEVLRSTGTAVLFATATTVAGFTALVVADYGAMQSFGWIMTLGISCCFAASVLVLPAMLVLLGRTR